MCVCVCAQRAYVLCLCLFVGWISWVGGVYHAGYLLSALPRKMVYWKCFSIKILTASGLKLSLVRWRKSYFSLRTPWHSLRKVTWSKSLSTSSQHYSWSNLNTQVSYTAANHCSEVKSMPALLHVENIKKEKKLFTTPVDPPVRRGWCYFYWLSDSTSLHLRKTLKIWTETISQICYYMTFKINFQCFLTVTFAIQYIRFNLIFLCIYIYTDKNINGLW